MIYTFPDEGQRIVYGPGVRRGSALTSARGTEILIFLDPDGEVQAEITTVNGDSIDDGIVTVGEDSLIPLFKGPDGVSILYGSVAGVGGVFPIYPATMHGSSGRPPVGSVDVSVVEGEADLATAVSDVPAAIYIIRPPTDDPDGETVGPDDPSFTITLPDPAMSPEITAIIGAYSLDKFSFTGPDLQVIPSPEYQSPASMAILYPSQDQWVLRWQPATTPVYGTIHRADAHIASLDPANPGPTVSLIDAASQPAYGGGYENVPRSGIAGAIVLISSSDEDGRTGLWCVTESGPFIRCPTQPLGDELVVVSNGIYGIWIGINGDHPTGGTSPHFPAVVFYPINLPVIRSPNGTRFLVVVDDNGDLSTQSV